MPDPGLPGVALCQGQPSSHAVHSPGGGEEMPGAKCATEQSFVSKEVRTKGKQAGNGGCRWGPWGRSSSRPRRTAGLQHRVGAVGGNEVRTVRGPAHRGVLAVSPHSTSRAPSQEGSRGSISNSRLPVGQGVPDQCQETGPPGLWGCSRCPSLWPEATELEWTGL